MPVLIQSVTAHPRSTFPNEEEATHIQVIGGPAVVLQGDKPTYVGADDENALKLEEGPYDVFALNSVRVVGYGEGELKTEAKKSRSKKS